MWATCHRMGKNSNTDTSAVQAASALFCPACGYYCIGAGGIFCIDKPTIVQVAKARALGETKMGEDRCDEKTCGLCHGEGMVRTVDAPTGKPCPDCTVQNNGGSEPFVHGPKTTEDPWKHRSKGMVCATCMWNVAKKIAQSHSQSNPTAEPQAVLGRCRRHAPTMSGYPAVFPNDWCGDHKLDENKI